MKAYVGVTDKDWYHFLAARPTLTEVNFWRPGGGRGFAAVEHGELFFFKTHYPHNSVVGGGFFSGFAPLRVSEAWEFFGQGNGAASLVGLRQQVGKYRSQPIAPGEDPVIGCIIIRDAVFFPDSRIAGPPPGFASNIVQGKSYDLSGPAGDYFQDLLRRMDIRDDMDLSQPWHRDGPVFGDPRLAPRRLGQQAFQAVVLHAYERRCAITGDKIRPVLQAAHIRPLSAGGEHRLDNGLLLRSDVHTLYDRGYLAVDPRHRLLVSPRLREEFGNGEEFYHQAGQQISVPERPRDRPNRDALEWHLDEVFLRR